MSARLEVADIFRDYGAAYRLRHPLSDQQRRAMHAIEVCRNVFKFVYRQAKRVPVETLFPGFVKTPA